MQRTLPLCIASVALAATMAVSVLEAQDNDTLVSVWDGVYTTAQAGRGSFGTPPSETLMK